MHVRVAAGHDKPPGHLPSRLRLVRKPSSLIRKAILISRNKLLVSGFTCSLKQAPGNSGEGRGQPGAGPDLCGSAPLAEEAAP